MRVHLIDVGQGAATLIEFSCAAILVDTGGELNDEFDSTKRLLDYLDRFFARRRDLRETLALLIITHPHIDHTRGAIEVWERFRVLSVVTNGTTVSSGRHEVDALLRASAAGGVPAQAIHARNVPSGGLHDHVIDAVACPDGDPDIRVFWGAVDGLELDWPLRARNDANNASVVTKISLGESSLLITGDLEEEGIVELLRHQRDSESLRADVYQVGHHGSLNATTTGLLDAVSPKVALIGVGRVDRHGIWTAWAHGHPRKGVVEMLEQRLTGTPRVPTSVHVAVEPRAFEPHVLTAPIYATGWDGNIVITMFASGEVVVATNH